MRICPTLAYDNGIGSAFFTGFKKLFFMNIHLAFFEITDIKGGPKVEIWVKQLLTFLCGLVILLQKKRQNKTFFPKHLSNSIS